MIDSPFVVQMESCQGRFEQQRYGVNICIFWFFVAQDNVIPDNWRINGRQILCT